jgi:hypothetical protein
VWRRARCLFNTPKRRSWHFLDWRDIYLLAWHPRDCNCDLPRNLRWIHKDVTRTSRRNRTIHIDFNKVGVEMGPDGCYSLIFDQGSPCDIARDKLSELTEDRGTHHDDHR